MQTKTTSDLFYSKVMLFGEYTIIHGSMGLTIPYSHFNGELRMINKNAYTDLNFATRSNHALTEYAQYLTNLQDLSQLPLKFNIQRLHHDLKKGLYFESSIPEGYGLGSSGALVAALYSRYMENAMPHRNGFSSEQIFQLKQIFATMESFFHGTSSGIDPLICYLKHPIFLENRQTIRAITISRKEIQPQDAIFLINSGQPGKTEPLVNLYLEKMKHSAYQSFIEKDHIPLTNRCIQTLLQGKLTEFMVQLNRFSTNQIENFREMIPNTIIPAWEKGLESQTYNLKLCGSGGGGYMLGFTRDYYQSIKELQKLHIETIPVYTPFANNAVGS